MQLWQMRSELFPGEIFGESPAKAEQTNPFMQRLQVRKMHQSGN